MIVIPDGYLAPLAWMPIETAFVCRSCGKTKLAGFFYRDFSVTDGFMPDCKACFEAQQPERAAAKIRHRKERAAKWRAERQKAPQRLLWQRAQKRALAKGVPFAITLADIVIPERCPILGIELGFSTGGPGDGSPSLDRVIPSLGYVPGNIRVISHKANTLKWNATAAELRAVADYIDAHLRALNS